jgi:hypothetical protein
MTSDLFIAAGALVAESIAQELAAGSRIEEILRRVVGHCAALRR